MNKRLILTILVMASCMITGCSSQQQDKKQVTVSLPSEAKADKLDAQSYDAAMPVYSAVYEPLVEYDKKHGIKAGLADEWKIEDGGRRYQFHLKNDVKFSDGSKFDAQAVKFSLERAKTINKESTVETLKQLDKVVI